MKKKRSALSVATMTFHLAHNYGAMLQAYALRHAVRKLGYHCRVLDYRFPYIHQWSGIHTWKDLLWLDGPLIGTAKHLRRLLHGHYAGQAPAQLKFNRFMREKMGLSFKTYFSPDELKKASYDAILFGSDQIWNPALTNGLAEEYFGGCFDSSSTRLIAYAASCGKDRLPSEYKDQIMSLLGRFHGLSVREESLAQTLRQDGLDVLAMPDPVLLLNTEEWDALIRNTPPVVSEPYVLIYAFDTGNDVYDIARRIAAERNLNCVSVCYKADPARQDMLQLTDCGPLEFLRLIRDARFVCTTSFHAEAFSILFEKSFYCIGHPLYSQRNADILRIVGLEDRMISSSAAVEQITDCDFSNTKARLEIQRNCAMVFLANAIEG